MVIRSQESGARGQPKAIHSYRDLLVWSRAMELAEAAYRLTRLFPKTEQYGLVSQIQRSAVSVASNIAEGHSRGSTKDFMRFLAIAAGSLSELETQLLLAGRLGYVAAPALEDLMSAAQQVGKMMNGLRSKLFAKLTPDP